MKTSLRSWTLSLAACLWGAAASPCSAAAEVAAVLSSKLDSYQQAFEGFQEAFAAPVATVNLQDDGSRIPRDVKVIVAFGGEAASLSHAGDVALVYCMAPGTRLEPRARGGPLVGISMLPAPARALPRFKEIQPNMKKLAFLWSSDAFKPYEKSLRKEAASMGLEILSFHLSGTQDLPDALRQMKGHVDALWFPPDPALINAGSFALVKEFSWSNQVPLYMPTEGLVKKGAAGAVSINFREVGRAAAEAVRLILAGKPCPEEVDPEKVEVVVNLTALAQTGVVLAEEVRKRVDKVIP